MKRKYKSNLPPAHFINDIRKNTHTRIHERYFFDFFFFLVCFFSLSVVYIFVHFLCVFFTVCPIEKEDVQFTVRKNNVKKAKKTTKHPDWVTVNQKTIFFLLCYSLITHFSVKFKRTPLKNSSKKQNNRHENFI